MKKTFVLPEKVKKTCCICGKEFLSEFPRRRACEECLEKDGGEYYADWWCRNNPVIVNIEDLANSLRNYLNKDARTSTERKKENA